MRTVEDGETLRLPLETTPMGIGFGNVAAQDELIFHRMHADGNVGGCRFCIAV
jgi:hypothetical protein